MSLTKLQKQLAQYKGVGETLTEVLRQYKETKDPGLVERLKELNRKLKEKQLIEERIIEIASGIHRNAELVIKNQ